MSSTASCWTTSTRRLGQLRTAAALQPGGRRRRGTAGLVTAAGAAGLGARVALVERDLSGRRLPQSSAACRPRRCCAAAAPPRRSGRPVGSACAAGDAAVDFPAGHGAHAAAAGRPEPQRLRRSVSATSAWTSFWAAARFTGTGYGRGCRQDAPTSAGRSSPREREPRPAGHPRPGGSRLPHQRDRLHSDRTAARAWPSSAPGRSAASWPRRSPASARESPSWETDPHILPREDPDAAGVVEKALERDGMNLIPRRQHRRA